MDRGNGIPVLPLLTSSKELMGILVDLQQKVDHEDWSYWVHEEPIMEIQHILQLQHPQHVGAPIPEQDFQQADIFTQHSHKTLEVLRGVPLDVCQGLQRGIMEVALLHNVTVIGLRCVPWDHKWCDAVGASIKRHIIVG